MAAFIWEYLIPIAVNGLFTLVIISYPVHVLVNFTIERREANKRKKMGELYGCRHLYVRQDARLIYYRRLTAEQSKLLQDAFENQPDLNASNDDLVGQEITACQLILSSVSGSVDANGKLSSVSGSVDANGKRNQTNAPLGRLEQMDTKNRDFSIDLDLRIEDNMP